jgi:DNA polymerase-3 subunit gamma/tau
MPEPVPVRVPEPLAMPEPLVFADAPPRQAPTARTADVEVIADQSAAASTEDAQSAGSAQQAAVEALAAAGHGSAADALADASWTISGSEAEVKTELSKTMLPIVLNAEAEKIARNAVRGLGVLRLTLLPGAVSATATTKKPKTAASGSVQAKAIEHPMVQEAQRLFNAEIQTVIDLRES